MTNQLTPLRVNNLYTQLNFLLSCLKTKNRFLVTLLILSFPANVFADDLPFQSTMTKLQNAIAGPFLISASVIMIVITCLMLAFGEWGDGFKKIINIVLWLSIAFAAAGFVTTMFGGSH